MRLKTIASPLRAQSGPSAWVWLISVVLHLWVFAHWPTWQAQAAPAPRWQIQFVTAPAAPDRLQNLTPPSPLPSSPNPPLAAPQPMARPQHVRTRETIDASGIEIFLAIDVSLSMSIEDMTLGNQTVNRLSAAKKVTRDFIQGRRSDRIGIVAFAGRPYVPSPLTLDHDWLLNTLSEQVKIGLVEDGTAIGSAIGAAARRLEGRDTEVKSKIIVLITDGSNNSGNLTPLDAARLAQTFGVRIYTIAVGTEGMHRIPLPDRSGRFLPGMRQEFDIDLMKQIAAMTNGMFFRAQDTRALEEIFKTIDTMEKTEIKRQTRTEVDEMFHVLVAAALATGLLGAALRLTAFREVPA